MRICDYDTTHIISVQDISVSGYILSAKITVNTSTQRRTVT